MTSYLEHPSVPQWRSLACACTCQAESPAQALLTWGVPLVLQQRSLVCARTCQAKPLAQALLAWVYRPYVLPDKYVVKLTDAELGVEPPQGILFVKLIEASNVPRMDMLSKSDPYVM